MTRDERAAWQERYRDRDSPGAPEPLVLEMIPLLPVGRALDVAAGLGRHSLALARAGMKVVAVDYSEAGLHTLMAAARHERLPISPVVADMISFPIGENRYDAIVNVNFLERELFAGFKAALGVGGMLLVDTFLIDQAAMGHPRNPRYLLGHYELMELVSGLEVVRYREGLTEYADGTKAWRASALASRRS
jgi:SAM-dependent methyltransferase